MISVAEAMELLAAQELHPRQEVLPIDRCSGRIIAADLYSEIEIPAFYQSSMDGYAIKVGEARQSWYVVGESKAGMAPAPELGPGEAMRIFTGAPLPPGCDCVVMQEYAQVQGDQVQLDPDHVNKGQFVRAPGSSVHKGQQIIQEGTFLSPGQIALLASCGFAELPVYGKVNVAIVASGDELIKPGQELKLGQIYESNTYTLSTAVELASANLVYVKTFPDDPDQMRAGLNDAFDSADVILLSGGISVGEYDFARTVLQDLGVEEIFYRVRQKPGKPLFFGKGDNKWVFALPGNPASSLVCFYLYALPLINRLGGNLSAAHLQRGRFKVSHPLKKKSPRASFERAFVQGESIRSLDGQQSYMLDSLARANALLVLPEGELNLEEGDEIEAILLPHARMH